jgi:hypothetical protein
MSADAWALQFKWVQILLILLILLVLLAKSKSSPAAAAPAGRCRLIKFTFEQALWMLMIIVTSLWQSMARRVPCFCVHKPTCSSAGSKSPVRKVSLSFIVTICVGVTSQALL